MKMLQSFGIHNSEIKSKILTVSNGAVVKFCITSGEKTNV